MSFVSINGACYALTTDADRAEAAAALREGPEDFARVLVLPGDSLPDGRAWNAVVDSGRALYRDGSIWPAPYRSRTVSESRADCGRHPGAWTVPAARVECERHPGYWTFAGYPCEQCRDAEREAFERELLESMRRR